MSRTRGMAVCVDRVCDTDDCTRCCKSILRTYAYARCGPCVSRFCLDCVDIGDPVVELPKCNGIQVTVYDPMFIRLIIANNDMLPLNGVELVDWFMQLVGEYIPTKL